MSLLLSDAQLAARGAELCAPASALSALAASLSDDLRVAITHPLDVPIDKALLSRDGGRCPHHGVPLEFDPYRPHEHRCPVDGEVHLGERHDRWWIMWFQLWLAERVVHASALAALGVDRSPASFAIRTLDAYADRYLAYPNRDNVLGPSRPFFSTYLESMWALQLCVAIDLLESANLGGSTSGRVRDRVLAPSLALIRSYDEGASNRQVWNNAALIALGALLDDRRAVERAIAGPSGVTSHLSTGLLEDGTWYEGENYHFFAHRGLWYGVTMLDRMGAPLPGALRERYAEAFATPLLTALPDFTFPARRDSQYGVSLRQWRFAESCELGLTCRDDPRLLGALWTLYDQGAIARRDTGRWRSTAEAERNEPASSLSRADLGWRSLLFARAVLPPLAPWPARSALLDGQGIAALRRDAGRTFVALDYGHSGGGHGHPDRLNVLLSHGPDRWLDDLGTGSYVDPSLHWYRSTLAHNAPFANGLSQGLTDGILRAYDERGGVGWVDAEVPAGGIAPGVGVRRSLIVMPDYALDQLVWSSDADTQLDLPLHFDGDVAPPLELRPAEPYRDASSQGAFAFVRDAARAALDAGAMVAIRRGDEPAVWIHVSTAAELWRMIGPGAPAEPDRRFHLVRVRGVGGRITAVWNWGASISRVTAHGDELVIDMRDGSTHVHRAAGDTWHVDFRANGARSSVDLDGRRANRAREAAPTAPPAPAAPVRIDLPVAPAPPLSFVLGRDSYRMSEDTWDQAGSPVAVVSLYASDGSLTVDVDVRKTPLAFRAPNAADPRLDNEDPDIHSDGVQFYAAADSWSEPAAWLAVPIPGTHDVRVHEVAGARTGVPMRASWRPTSAGYAVRLSVPLEALRVDGARALWIQVVVNDMDASRTRRRGQLVLTGGAGEHVYLRGDRESRERFLRVVLPDV